MYAFHVFFEHYCYLEVFMFEKRSPEDELIENHSYIIHLILEIITLTILFILLLIDQPFILFLKQQFLISKFPQE